MATDRNRFSCRAGHEIDACDVPALRDATSVYAHQLRERIAALFGGAVSRGWLPPAHDRHVGDRSILAEHGGHRQDAERNGLEESAAVGVKDGDRIVGG